MIRRCAYWITVRVVDCAMTTIVTCQSKENLQVKRYTQLRDSFAQLINYVLLSSTYAKCLRIVPLFRSTCDSEMIFSVKKCRRRQRILQLFLKIRKAKTASFWHDTRQYVPLTEWEGRLSGDCYMMKDIKMGSNSR